MKKPNKNSIAVAFHSYLDLTPNDDLLKNLQLINNTTIEVLRNIPKEKEEFKYQLDKWSLKKVICHLIASEIYFCDLVIRLTKEDSTQTLNFPLSKYDVDKNSQKSLSEISNDFITIRKATIQFFYDFDTNLIDNVYTINGNNYSPVGVGYIIMGHELHHMNVIQEKYLK